MEKMFARDYRKVAHEKCNKFSNQLALIYLVYAVITVLLTVLSYISIGSIVSLLITGPFTLSLIIIAEKTYNEEASYVNDLFSGFSDFGNSLGLYILQSIFTLLWSLLFIIPGLIKTFSYAMCFYIHKDRPELPLNECITESRKMMDGHKWELFCLSFSYVGWLILCCLTFGILSLWVLPKIEVAKYVFYLNISGKLNEVEVVEENNDYVVDVEL